MGVELIAEVSSNHGGDLVLAKEFIHAFADAGADWVKFQTTRVKHLNPKDPQYAWFQQAELSDDAHYELKAECEKAGTKFLTTVFNVAEVPFLLSLGVEAIKVGSGEASEGAIAKALWRWPGRVIVSTGLQWSPCHTAFAARHRTDYLRCSSRYPSPPAFAHADYHGVDMWPYAGYSDHAVGLDGCRVAIADGATIIEKHVRLSPQARPSKPYEASVSEFRELRLFANEKPERFLGRWQYA